MLNLSLDKQLLIFLNEVLDNRRLLAIAFFIISITILIIGLNSPKTYESSTTLLWNRSNVLNPLLKGTAVTSIETKQSIAQEIILSNKNLELLIEKMGLAYSPSGEKLSPREIEYLKAGFRNSIKIGRKKNNTLKFSYKNTNPEKAFLVVSVISRLFVEERILNRKTDSSVAYNFIDKQVSEYQVKLEEITKSIDEFKSQNKELQIDTTQSVNANVSNLKEKIKNTTQEIKEETIKKNALTEQLLIESAKSRIVEKENTKMERLLGLKDKLSILRLSYTEGYPDIVQIKEQIIILERSMENNAFSRSNDANSYIPDDGILGSGVNVKSQFSQQLQRQLLAIEVTLKTLSARKNDHEKQLALELDRSGDVLLAFNRLKVLSKDYDVTNSNYDKLKAKREKARISLSLETEKAESLYQVQEPPVVPLIPEGIRFAHFALGSIIVGVVAPLAIIFGLLMIDPRIRHEDDIDFDVAIPVIGVIPIFKTAIDLKKQRLATIQAIIIFSLSLILLVTLSLSRFLEVI